MIDFRYLYGLSSKPRSLNPDTDRILKLAISSAKPSFKPTNPPNYDYSRVLDQLYEPNQKRLLEYMGAFPLETVELQQDLKAAVPVTEPVGPFNPQQAKPSKLQEHNFIEEFAIAVDPKFVIELISSATLSPRQFELIQRYHQSFSELIKQSAFTIVTQATEPFTPSQERLLSVLLNVNRLTADSIAQLQELFTKSESDEQEVQNSDKPSKLSESFKTPSQRIQDK